jgi:DNA-binding transcriptional LysR family regulator
MSLKPLRTFVAIAESGSFAAAGTRLFLTHAAVSMQMRALESELAVSLFDRSHRPPQLTETGKALLPMAVDLIRAYDHLPAALQSPDAEKSQLLLGAIPSSLTSFTPRILKALQRRHPQLHVTLTSRLTEELMQMVEVGSIDAAFVSHIPEPFSNLEWRAFFREPLAVLAPPDAPVMTAERLLTDMPFIHFRRSMWIGRLIENLLRARRIRVREIMVLDTVEAVASMVAQGLGVAIAPVGRFEPPFGTAPRIVPLPRPTVYRTLGLAFRSARKKDPLISSLIAELEGLAKGSDYEV